MFKLKKSTLPKAGLGLFTEVPFKKGDKIVEYEGDQYTWAECLKRAEEGKANYVFYITAKKCVDAYDCPNALARYANDAKGLSRVKGINNNAQYEVIKGKPYIVATKRIKPGEEILVSYGKDYWKHHETNKKK